MTEPKKQSFLSADGEMGALLRSTDWSSHPLGEPESWPQPLKTMLRMAFNTHHPVFIFWGPEHFCFYNDRYRASIGADKHPSMFGARGADMWPEIWHIIGPQIEMVMRGEGATWYENALVPIYRDGVLEDMYWTYSYGPIDDPDAPTGVGGVLVLCTVTTEQVRTAQKLEIEKQNFARLFEQSPSFMTLLTGPDHVFEMANPEYMRLIGHREIFGKTVAEVLPEAAEQGYIDVLDTVFRTGEPYIASSARFLRNVSGGPMEERFIDFVYQPIVDGNGNVVSIFVQGVDVSDRDAAHADLRRSAERLRFLDDLGQQVASCRDADQILAITTRMVAQHMNLSNCAYADMDPDEDGFTIRGDWAAPGSPRIGGHYSLRDFGRLAVEKLSAGEPLVVNDNRAELAPDEAATFQAIGITATICMPLVKEGRLTALMAIHDKDPHVWQPEELALIREVSERSWAHIERVRTEAALLESREALQRANENLELLVAERTTELMVAEESLRQAQKMEAVGQLTGGLAHDFNNLLAGILGSLDMMRRRLEQGRLSELDRYVTAAMGAARRGAALTQRMLAFSRRQTLDPKPTDVNGLISGMEELIRRSIGPMIELETRVPDDLWPSLVDPGQLENALLNLCINGRDAMPAGGRLTVGTSNVRLDARAAAQVNLKPGQYIALSVTDTGTGMEPSVIARAFDPFYTTKPTGQGTGLGLSMVWGFAGQSGGSVQISSDVGVGTTVCIYLPRFHGDAAEELQARKADLPMAHEHPTVLVVDDEPLVRMLAAEQLADLGYDVIEAQDAREALLALETDRPIGLLVTDVGLPNGMNGRQLADAARATRPDLPVLFVTGYAESTVLNHGDLAPGMHIMIKPFDMNAFAHRVKNLTEEKPAPVSA